MAVEFHVVILIARFSTSMLLCFSEEQAIIASYYWSGFKYSSIVRFLAEYHDISISIRTLHRRLADYGLSRRKQPPQIVDVFNAVRQELRGPGMPIHAVYDY